MSMRKAAQLLTGGIILSATVLATAAPALAANTDVFGTVNPSSYCGSGTAYGTIDWYNRTALIDGSVSDYTLTGCTTTVVFEAFAGDRRIGEAETRSANNDANSDLYNTNYYAFTMGDPNLVGGIDRMKIRVCADYGKPTQQCTQETQRKNS